MGKFKKNNNGEYPQIDMIKFLYFLDWTRFAAFLGQNSKYDLVSFLVQMRTRKFASVIYGPLYLNQDWKLKQRFLTVI